jgi:transcriptional regulator with XRE-family HTH domain
VTPDKGTRHEADAAAARIGDRVAAIRGSQGLTVSEVARRVGVSASAISQIERGQSRPSVGTLFALARALDMAVDAFFDSDEKAAEPHAGVSEALAASGAAVRQDAGAARRHRYLVPHAERPTLDIKGGVRWERLTPTALEGLDFLELVYAPRAESDPELYRHPGVEMVLVLEGRLDIFVGFEHHKLHPGDSIAFPSSIPHRYVNPIDQVSRAVTVILRDDLSSIGVTGLARTAAQRIEAPVEDAPTTIP